MSKNETLSQSGEINMSQNKISSESRSFYDAKVFVPLLISLALMVGLFQNCASSSEFGSGQDPLAIQNQAQDITPVIMTDGTVNLTRLEGSPLQLGIPTDLFSDQGLTSCPSATYSWSFQSNVLDSSPTPLVESNSALQFVGLKLSDEGSYFVDVECNDQTYQLGPTALDVVPKLKLVNSNVTNQTVSEGSTANLDATFSGPTPISYQWFYAPSSGSKVALAGETSQQLEILNAEVSDQGDYELVATSTEGGIAQTITAGPGRLTVLPMSSLSGSVSGTTNLQTGQPIELTSAVSGAVSPTYQWYYNSVVITGSIGPNFELPNSQPSDSGVYSLVVVDDGTSYQIGSVNVVVSCAPGHVLVGTQCFSAVRTCSTTNGSGVSFIRPDGTYGDCTVTACDPGFINVNNTCLQTVGSCPIDNGVGTTTYGTNGQPSACTVQSCDTGYVNINNSCQQQVCPINNGVGLIHVEDSALICRAEYCNVDYVKYENACVPRVQSCPIQNGNGNLEHTESGPGECLVTTCNAGYVNIQNSCVKRDCDVANGQGVIALSPSGAIQCRAVSCDSGYFMSGNQCVSQICSTGNGTGYWASVGNQQICQLTNCNSPDQVIINNQCIASACAVTNGTGSIAINQNNQTYCRPLSCDAGYAIVGNVCTQTGGNTCRVSHGSGILNGSVCQVNSCDSGYVAYNNQCVRQVQSCSVSNGRGSVTYTVSGPGVCNVTSCNSGFVRQGNQCISGNQACPITNGTGYRTAYSNGFSQCLVASCDSGYGATLTQQCLPLERACYQGSGTGVQHLTSYGYSACKINQCDPEETMIMGACRPNEKLLCEPHDRNKNAKGGKVFGYVYSLLKNKSNVNLNTARLPSNRLSGHVFYKRFNFSGGTYLYDTEDEVIRHKDGSDVRNWFGMELYSTVLPPDGASSGDYILALSSDDGSGLDCKVNGTWRNFINHTNGNSCGVIRQAPGHVTISRDRPLPVKITYFQNSGSGRCLRLLYKKVGSTKGFKTVPKSRLMLPHDTVNMCPN